MSALAADQGHALMRAIPLLLFTLVAGCAGTGRRVECRRCPVEDTGPVVLVADGAGDFLEASISLRRAAAGTPLCVQTFHWSHGPGRIFADHFGRENIRLAGNRLAEQVVCYRQAPGVPRPIYLVGHSAGAAVLLEAAQLLPPNSVERIVLLSPALSADCDLRPLLAAARQGVDVFYSDRDRVVLGLGTAILGTAEGGSGPAAGRVGFRVPAPSAAGAGLYTKLRQYPWDPVVSWSGNEGGHFGSNQERFLRAYVVPLLAPPLAVSR